MVYELITIENGDILQTFDGLEEAAASLRDYIERHCATNPGIDQQVAVVELADDGRTRHGLLRYEHTVDTRDAAAIH
jgi:ATP-dependent protease HslVU (ClpYQ) peptidase subunit